MTTDVAFILGVLVGIPGGFALWKIYVGVREDRVAKALAVEAARRQSLRDRYVQLQHDLAEKLRELADSPTPGCSCDRCSEMLARRAVSN